MSFARAPGCILILWNQVEDDVYEHFRASGKTTVEWDPNREVPEVDTIADELAELESILRERGHHVTSVNIRDDVRTLIAAIEEHRPDAVFNLVEFYRNDPSHECDIAAVYETLGVAYTGFRPGPLHVCQQKHLTKAIVRAAGLPTAAYIVVPPTGEVPADLALRFPVIVKPALGDASGGIDTMSVCADPDAMMRQLALVLVKFPGPVVVEEFIDGRELHCAILGETGDGQGARPLPLFEFEFYDTDDGAGAKLPKIITYRAKWDPYSRDFYAMDGVCPAKDLDPDVVAHVQDIALRAFHAVGGRDYARVDMRLDPRTGDPVILEVNPNPYLADGSAYVQSATAAGMTYADVLDHVVHCALARGRVAKGRPTQAPPEDLLAELLSKAPQPSPS